MKESIGLKSIAITTMFICVLFLDKAPLVFCILMLNCLEVFWLIDKTDNLHNNNEELEEEYYE